jgi:hypothetical protein
MANLKLDPSLIKAEQYVGKLMQIAMNQYLPQSQFEGLYERMTIEERADILMRGMVYTLSTYVAANVHEDYQTIQYPEGWWEAFKEEHFPSWLKARYPVKYHTERIKVSTSRMCPHVSTGSRNIREHLTWMFTPPLGDENEQKDSNSYPQS